MKEGSWFGDVHALFELKSNFLVKSEPYHNTVKDFLEYNKRKSENL
jgi:hypothetical protein